VKQVGGSHWHRQAGIGQRLFELGHNLVALAGVASMGTSR